MFSHTWCWLFLQLDNYSITIFSETKHEKKGWADEEDEILMERFEDKILHNMSISGLEIQSCINENHSLAGRSVAQVRSHLQFCKKKLSAETKEKKHKGKKRKNSDLPQEITQRNKIPKCVYQHFQTNIVQKEVPTVDECAKAYHKSSKFAKYTPSNIQKLVERAIHFDGGYE